MQILVFAVEKEEKNKDKKPELCCWKDKGEDDEHEEVKTAFYCVVVASARAEGKG